MANGYHIGLGRYRKYIVVKTIIYYAGKGFCHHAPKPLPLLKLDYVSLNSRNWYLSGYFILLCFSLSPCPFLLQNIS